MDRKKLFKAICRKSDFTVKDEILIGYFGAEGEDYFETCATHFDLFPGWFNDRYLWQCLYNLQEKYDCGMIAVEEWEKIQEAMNERILTGR